MPAAHAEPTPAPPGWRWRRLLLWAALVALLLVAQSLLLVLTINQEATRLQDETESLALETVGDVKGELARNLQGLQGLMWQQPAPLRWREEATQILRQQRAVLRLERRENTMEIADAQDSAQHGALFGRLRRQDLEVETTQACADARRHASPAYSRSFFVPMLGGQGLEVMDLCIPVLSDGREEGFLVATFSLQALLESVLSRERSRAFEFSFVEADGSRLARAGLPRGAGVYRAERLVDLPGAGLQLRVNSAAGRPSLVPNLTTALVLGLSLALFGLVIVLARDVRMRSRAERQLAEALAFRKAMEDSLSTGLRARDLAGRITYVNPAFCAMVGFAPEALLGQAQPPYWPSELAAEYQRRQAHRLTPPVAGQVAAREGFETLFMRLGGERFPVMIYEAPLVDGQGRHTGWMSAALDISHQRRMEELARQQQEKLQATARLATVGEMASLLSHELNQPLAAIASYASGSLNMADEPDAQALMRQGLQRICEQADRAGRVIKSVHDFVRRREQSREALDTAALLDAALPLVRMQARKSGTQIELDLPAAAAVVWCDRTMIEQVLINLARNAIQAMEPLEPGQRVLTLRVRQAHARWVAFSVIDNGPGISAEVAARLFTPFFTTRAEGMGLGLSLCRTVVEQHGGDLTFASPPPGRTVGTEFRFTLAAPPTAGDPATT